MNSTMVNHQEVPDNEANFEGLEEGEDDSDLGYILPPRLGEPSKTILRTKRGKGLNRLFLTKNTCFF